MLKIKYVKKLATELLGLPVYLLSTFSIRSKKIMVFGEWHGHNYCDNTKYFFEYVSSNHAEQTAIWITKNKNVKNIITEKGYKCEYAYSLKGFYYCFRAKYAFVTHDSADINQYLLGKCKLVNLTHGTPLKKLGNDAKYARLGKFTYIYDRYLKKITPSKKKFDYIFCADEKAKNRFESSYSYPVNIYAYGYPRWSGLNNSNHSKLKDKAVKYRKVISYLPTLRFNNHKQLDPFSFNGFKEFCKYIESNNYLLIIRPHPIMIFLNDKVSSDNIVFATSPEIRDVNEVLNITDILISDYSSVIYDFEKTGKPIVLLAPDAETYINDDVGVYGNYYEDFEWPIINDWFSAIDCIEVDAINEVNEAKLSNAASSKIYNFIESCNDH